MKANKLKAEIENYSDRLVSHVPWCGLKKDE